MWLLPAFSGLEMAELDVESGETADDPGRLRQCTVLVGETRAADPEFPVCLFDLSAEAGEGVEAGTATVAIILVTEVEGQLLAVFPKPAWDRRVSSRVLPPGVFQKPVAVDLDFDDRAEPGVGYQARRRVWFGLLKSEAEDKVVLPSETLEPLEPDILFDESSPSFLPLASGLAKIAEEHFGFVSATSGDGLVSAARPIAPEAGLDDRLKRLEDAVQAIAANLGQLPAGATSADPAFGRRVRKPALRPAAASGPGGAAAPPDGPCHPPGLPGPGRFAVAGLDLEVVRSARLAGVPEEHIAEMARLVSQGKQKLPDFPEAPRRKQTANALSESEEEDEKVPDGLLQSAGEQSSSSLTTAVAKLTEIASHLTAQKRQERSLEALLDGVGSAGAGDSAQVPGSRKYAAALRALRKTLTSKPEEIYKAVEQNMTEDFQMQAQLPGSTAIPVSARAWLELRSRVQNYATPVRLLWGIAGVHDALRAGLHAEARARCALLLAQGDQLSIDRGSWIIAGELSLEEPPPAAAFAAHTLPGDTEAPYSRLIDGRWFDLFLQKLNDYDNLAEKKRKLGSKRLSLPSQSAPSSETTAAKPDPKKKGKAKGKGKSGGGGAAEAEEPAAATEK